MRNQRLHRLVQWIVEAFAEHVIHIDGAFLVVFDILAVQAFGGYFRTEDSGFVRLGGQFEFIFEEAFACAVDAVL